MLHACTGLNDNTNDIDDNEESRNRNNNQAIVLYLLLQITLYFRRVSGSVEVNGCGFWCKCDVTTLTFYVENMTGNYCRFRHR